MLPDLEPDEWIQRIAWFPRTFEAFKDVNYRWYFGALFGNFASMNMQMFVRGWLVFEITGSYAKLGWMSAAGGVVGLVMAPYGGVLADRVRQKKHIVQICQALNAAITLAIGVLIAMNMLTFEHLLYSSIAQGIVQSAMMPARQAMTFDVVGPQLMTNAIALNTSGMNVNRLLLPGLAGGMVAALGGGAGNIDPAKYVYLMMTAVSIFSVLMMAKVRVDDRTDDQRDQESMWRSVWMGVQYIRDTPIILMLLAFNFVMVLFSLTYFALLPGFAKEVLNAGPDRLGLLISISGVGSLLGSLVIASMAASRRALLLLYNALLLGVGLVVFAISTHYWTSVVLLTFVGFGQAGRMSLSNALLQDYCVDEFRGRVMSIYMLEMSVIAISIYPTSLLADWIGPQWTVGLSGLGLIILVGILFRVPVYRNLD